MDGGVVGRRFGEIPQGIPYAYTGRIGYGVDDELSLPWSCRDQAVVIVNVHYKHKSDL